MNASPPVPIEISWQWRNFSELRAEELYEILKLRQDVFLLEQQCLYADADGEDAKASHLMGLSSQGELAAYCRTFAPGDRFEQASIGRIIVARNWRGSGVGHRLVEEAIRYCNQQYSDAPILIDGQTHLTGFYEQHGFEATGEERMEDGIPHVKMLRTATTRNQP